MELPAFAAFPLVKTDHGKDRLRRYYPDYLELAAEAPAGYELGYSPDVGNLADASADLVTAFTVETDGRPASGSSLGEAIEQVDAATGSAPAWFMVNCAHPDHVLPGLPAESAPWLSRIGAYRANASRMSHAELDEATELDAGDPSDLTGGYLALRHKIPSIRVIGAGAALTSAASLPRPTRGATAKP